LLLLPTNWKPESKPMGVLELSTSLRHGSANDDCVTEWFAPTNVNWMMSPGCADTCGGLNMSMASAPTWTSMTFGCAFGVGFGLFGYEA
jgi:hypothetical protein